MSFTPWLISDQTPWSLVSQYKIGASYSLKQEDLFIKFIEDFPNNLTLDTASFNSAQDKMISNDVINRYLEILE
jgi:hypothetical protein